MEKYITKASKKLHWQQSSSWKYIDVTDPTKDKFTQPLSVQDIQDESEISKADYNRVLSISKDENLELHFKRQPNSCFVDSYHDGGLNDWHANKDIQLVFN